jgi:hypothetical protein
MSDSEAHAAIKADPDAYPRDENFWVDVGIILPRFR